MTDQIDRQPDASWQAEGTGLGERFGLGPCTRVWLARRPHERWKWGVCLLVVAFVFAILLLIPDGTVRLVLGTIGGLFALAGVTQLVRSPPARWDRLFQFPGGIVQQASEEPEPAVVRWAEAATVELAFDIGDGPPTLESCLLTSETGMSVRADRQYGQAALTALVTEAERALVPRLLPGLIRDFEAGQPVVFGGLTVSLAGLSGHPDSAVRKPWALAWAEIGRVTVRGPGRTLQVIPRGSTALSTRWSTIAPAPNGILARHVVEHAAAQHGIDVRQAW